MARWTEKEAMMGVEDVSDLPDVWIRVTQMVVSELPFSNLSVEPGIYKAKSNQHGALSVITSSGEALGIKPDEFELLPYEIVRIFEGYEARVRELKKECAELSGFSCADHGCPCCPECMEVFDLALELATENHPGCANGEKAASWCDEQCGIHWAKRFLSEAREALGASK